MEVSAQREDPVGVVVVGGGAAAHACVAAYRDHGGLLPVTMVSDDDRLPYFRPSLTKELVTGEQGFDAIGLEDDAGWYARRQIDVRLSCAATGIDLTARTVATQQGPIAFGSLVLATGSSAATLPVPGGDHPALVTIRHAADTERLLQIVGEGRHVLVIGSGFVGCEVAASLRLRGVDVTMATMEAAPQVDRLGPAVGRLIGSWLEDLGVRIHAGVRVTGFAHRPESTQAIFGDDLAIEAGAVIVASGATTNVGIARTAQLTGADGRSVEVDASMRAAAPGVFAAGDIADALHPVAGRRLRVEHWGDAERMGVVAGKVIAGHHASWTEVPGFWSNIGGRQLKYVAWGDGFDDVLVRPSPDGVTVWYGREGLCAGILTHDHDDDLAVGEALIAANAPFPPP